MTNVKILCPVRMICFFSAKSRLLSGGYDISGCNIFFLTGLWSLILDCMSFLTKFKLYNYSLFRTEGVLSISRSVKVNGEPTRMTECFSAEQF